MSVATSAKTTDEIETIDGERQRLIHQSRLFRPFTKRLFLDAGIGPGMRVLELGSGAGEIYRPGISVHADDGSGWPDEFGEQERHVAREGDIPTISFVERDPRDLDVDGEFDACVGCLFVTLESDPLMIVRRAVRSVRPGGVVAFQDMDFTVMPPPSWPASPLLNLCGDLVDRAFRWRRRGHGPRHL